MKKDKKNQTDLSVNGQNIPATDGTATVDKKKTTSYFMRQERIAGWILVAPICIGFLLFVIFPIVFALVLAFTQYTGGDSIFATFGLENFIGANSIFTDEHFTRGLLNALVYALGGPVGTFLSLILAAMLCSIKKMSLFYRMVFYLPTLCGAVAVTYIWQWMYAPSYGIIASIFNDFGISMGNFKFLDENNFLWSMMIMGIWSGFGVSVLMFFSNLKGISKSLYESASLDGANAYRKFMSITLPAISPVMFYIIVTGFIGSLQVFTQFQVMANNNTAVGFMSPVWWIYSEAFSNAKFGYASSMGLFLGVVILLITVIQFTVSHFWVSYD